MNIIRLYRQSTEDEVLYGCSRRCEQTLQRGIIFYRATEKHVQAAHNPGDRAQAQLNIAGPREPIHQGESYMFKIAVIFY